MEEGIEKQKAYFDLLSEMIGVNINVSKNVKEGSVYRPGYQYVLGIKGCPFPPYDHRSIGLNEIVLDFDADSYSQNAKYAKIIDDYLRAQEIPHYLFWTGGKGIHLHIFIDLHYGDSTEKLLVKVLDKGVNIWKEVRLKLVKGILNQSGINIDLLGKVIDLKKISFDDMGEHYPLIRACGGDNIKIDSVTGEIRHAFKMYMPELLMSKPKPEKDSVWEFDEVCYPDKLDIYNIHEEFLIELCNELLTREEHTKTRIDFDGQYMNLPCIKRIMEGMDAGKRGFGAQQITIASFKDGNSVDKTKEILKTYVGNCSQSPEKFDIRETDKWVKWVYANPNPYFACGICVSLSVCDRLDCDLDKGGNKEIIEYYEKNDYWAEVKECLDILIAGEDHLKMMLYMIFGTTIFDPQWYIKMDGVSSSGKSYILKSVAKLFGEEDKDYKIISRITPAALNRLEPEEFNGKIVLIEEMQGISSGAAEQIRVLITEHQLCLYETIKVKVGGIEMNKMNEKKIRVKNCLFATCEAEDNDAGDQMASRAWILNSDGSTEQTGKVIEYSSKLAHGYDMEEDVKLLLERIRSYKRSLISPTKVIIPKYMIDILIKFIPTRDARMRRDIKKLFTLIYSVAVDNQRKRNWIIDSDKKILICDVEDIDIALRRYNGWQYFLASTQGLGEKDARMLDIIIANLGYAGDDYEFTVQDVERWCKINRSQAAKLLSNLCHIGFCENQTRKPMPAKYKRVDFIKFGGDLEMFFRELIEKKAEMTLDKVKEDYFKCSKK